MKKAYLATVALALLPGLGVADDCCKDSVDMVAYSQIDGSNGMQLAWRNDASQPWQPLHYTFVNSDFGPWGSHKKMYAPNLASQPGGTWLLTWIADPEEGVMATAYSADLISWSPQTYALSQQQRSVGQYVVDGKPVVGNHLRVPKCLVGRLQRYVAERDSLSALYAETAASVEPQLAALSDVKYRVVANPKAAKPISDKLIGIFFEDINYAADGGLYAELVQNRDFEYQPSDRGGDKKWHALTAWRFPAKDKGCAVIDSLQPLHANNAHYLRVDAKAGFAVENAGYDGIALRGGESYDFSMRARGQGQVQLSLVGPDGDIVAKSSPINIDSDKWEAVETVITATRDESQAKLVLTMVDDSRLDLDMVSLFPQSTFRGRRNGLRADLAQALADLHPRFVRFPGGCVAHGDGIDNIYDWKGSVGPLEIRKPLRNLWGYHQTRGLGYYEYFQFCEDIGAEPLPVLAAGVPCQNSGTRAHHSHDALTTRGQQCGVPLDEMDAYVQDVLDLIEYANGPADSQWGAVRAQAGHPEPFGLKYIGIGNEDMITEVFEERFRIIYDAVRAAHPEIEVVGTVGPFYEGTDYVQGWRLARELEVPYVDEHYYVQPGWMVYNQDFYDNYDRGGTQVYLGEYASHLPDRERNLETALTEALYLTSVERNGDVVAMTSYAPLLAKKGHTQWNPDLIYFNNTDIMPTVSYYTQQLYGRNSGDSYVPASATLSASDPKAAPRVGSSIVHDSATGDYIVKLVNLLPVAVDAQVDLSRLKTKAGTAHGWVLAGQPAQEQVAPEEVELPMPRDRVLELKLQPYSFEVLRIKTSNKR